MMPRRNLESKSRNLTDAPCDHLGLKGEERDGFRKN
jgi:hypothetical protein